MSLNVISISTQCNKEILLIMAFRKVATLKSFKVSLHSSKLRHGNKAKVLMEISGKVKNSSQAP